MLELAFRIDVLRADTKTWLYEESVALFNKFFSMEPEAYLISYEIGKASEKPHLHIYLVYDTTLKVKFETFKKKFNKQLRELISKELEIKLLPHHSCLQEVADTMKYLAYCIKDGDVLQTEGITESDMKQAKFNAMQIEADKKKKTRLKVMDHLSKKSYDLVEDLIYDVHDLYINQWNKPAPPPHVLKAIIQQYVFKSGDKQALAKICYIPDIQLCKNPNVENKNSVDIDDEDLSDYEDSSDEE